LDFFAKHAAAGVQFVNRQLRAVVRRLAERGLAAGERRKLADLDGVAARAGIGRRTVAAGEKKRCGRSPPKIVRARFS
jgi:hypothetical protein